MSQAAAVPELFQFRYAMFPEKARWALDHCGIEYRSRPVLPGPHVPIMLAKTGQKCTPVLKTANGMVKSSSAIVEWAHQQMDDSKLYGDNDEEAAQIKALVSEYDEIGPHARRAYFSNLIQDSRYAADLFSTGYSDNARRAYRAGFGGTKLVMRVDMNIWPKATAKSFAVVEQALNALADRVSETGYLVGNQFTAADLTAATVFGVCVLPDEYPIPVPQPYPAPMQEWLDRWDNHPAAAWIKRIYAEHRPAPLAIGGL